jgi:hypothetical protein
MSHHFFDFQNYPGRLLFYFFFLFENWEKKTLKRKEEKAASTINKPGSIA